MCGQEWQHLRGRDLREAVCSYTLCFYMKDGDAFCKLVSVPWPNCSVTAGRESGEKVLQVVLLGEILLMLLYFQRDIEKLKKESYKESCDHHSFWIKLGRYRF